MRHIGSVALFCCCVVLVCSAQFKLHSRTPSEMAAGQRQLVGAYCRADFDGGRLSDAGWERMKNSVRNGRNPEFAVIKIVSRYSIQPQEEVSINVPVTYYVIGTYELAFGYAPSSSTESETFRVEDKGGELTITDVPTTPYVSKRAMVQWLKTELANAKDDAKKAQIQSALNALEGAQSVGNPAK